MPIRSVSDVIYTILAWGPLLVFVAAFTLWIMTGMVHFEARTWGTEWFISNEGSVNEVEFYSNRDSDHELVL